MSLLLRTLRFKTMKVDRRKALTLSLGLLSFTCSGCITGSFEGTEDYLKVCVERVPSPTPPKCQKLTPSAVRESDKALVDWVYLPYRSNVPELQSFLDRARAVQGGIVQDSQ